LADLTKEAVFKKTSVFWDALRILTVLFEENEIERNEKKLGTLKYL
jgi:hypothetical protein